MANQPVLIIAEAGVNHNGDLSRAFEMIDVAADCGVDVVKFQTFKTESLVTKQAATAEYQNKANSAIKTQFELLKSLELSEANFYELQNHCQKKNIHFLSTGFDLESLMFLKKLKMQYWKIPSGEITNYPILEFIGQQQQEVIMSTGMSTLQEVSDAVSVLLKNGTSAEKITLLHCTTEYPTPFTDVNLRAMQTMQTELKMQVGYSDHTLGIEIPVAAVALGARVIEKHFTLDKTLPGPDHRASLEPHELKSMVSSIRNIEKALGQGLKVPSQSEKKNILAARKFLVAKKTISKGEIFNAENLTTKRSGGGKSAMLWNEVLGTVATKNYQEDDII